MSIRLTKITTLSKVVGRRFFPFGSLPILEGYVSFFGVLINRHLRKHTHNSSPVANVAFHPGDGFSKIKKRVPFEEKNRSCMVANCFYKYNVTQVPLTNPTIGQKNLSWHLTISACKAWKLSWQESFATEETR